jgi:uncharacterized membrane protein YqjE
MTAESTPPAPRAGDASIGELVSQLSTQTSRLVRDELRLAQVELAAKGKKAGIGAGLFGGAGIFAVYGLGCLVAAAILGLAAGPLSGWAAALIIGAALFIIAGMAALIGKREVAEATPPIPTEAVEGLQQDVQTLKAGSNA